MYIIEGRKLLKKHIKDVGTNKNNNHLIKKRVAEKIHNIINSFILVF